MDGCGKAFKVKGGTKSRVKRCPRHQKELHKADYASRKGKQVLRLPAAPLRDAVAALPTRAVLPWGSIGLKQQRRRIAMVKAVAAALEVPLNALQQRRGRLSPTRFTALTKKERTVMRVVPQLRQLAAGEKAVVACKLQLAVTHGTATAVFDADGLRGSYIRDPQRFVQRIASNSSWLAVGGDAGGGYTKLGVSFTNSQGSAEFAALVVYEGKDNFASLSKLARPGVLSFVGSSAAYATIYFFLQLLLFTRAPRSFLHGDWSFINAILGYSTATAEYGCPCCLARRADNFAPAAPRPLLCHVGSYSKKHEALLVVRSSDIVPTPLHVMLGLFNRITRKTLPLLLGEDATKASLQAVRTKHAYSPGAAGVHDLNGPELASWLKRTDVDALSAAAPEGARENISLLVGWLRRLYSLLLHKGAWSPEQQTECEELVADMQRDWVGFTNTRITPKVHMLSHIVSFAAQHGHLGRYSEAPIESYHARFNRQMLITHRNKSRDIPEQMRRSLAQLALVSIAPPAAAGAKML